MKREFIHQGYINHISCQSPAWDWSWQHPASNNETATIRVWKAFWWTLDNPTYYGKLIPKGWPKQVSWLEIADEPSAGYMRVKLLLWDILWFWTEPSLRRTSQCQLPKLQEYYNNDDKNQSGKRERKRNHSFGAKEVKDSFSLSSTFTYFLKNFFP